MRLTATTARSLTCPDGKSEQTFFDDDLPGFGLRVRASGSKSWLYQYAVAGLTKKVFLGSPAVVDAGKARAAAKDLAAGVRLGNDPAREKNESRAKAAETFGALLPRFLDRQRERLKPRSYVETERYLRVRAKALHPLPVETIERRTIASLLAGIEKDGTTTANRARAALSAYFNWAAREGYLNQNPASFTNKAVESRTRERTPDDDELGAILRALPDDDYGAIIRLLILLGARRDEIGALTWTEIDFKAATVTLSGDRTKSGQPHIIPLSPAATGILKSRTQRIGPEGQAIDYVFGSRAGPFSGWSRAKAGLDDRIAAMRGGRALPHWTLHDLRRSLSTALHERFNVPPHVVESILGHVSGHKAGVAGVYNKALYLAERRRALTRWADQIIAPASGEPATAQVVNLR